MYMYIYIYIFIYSFIYLYICIYIYMCVCLSISVLIIFHHIPKVSNFDHVHADAGVVPFHAGTEYYTAPSSNTVFQKRGS